MARIKNGILGSIQGKVANLVGYELNQQKIIRTIGVNTKPPTEKQLNNRLQMAVVMEFLSGLDTLIKTGFNPQAAGTTKNYHNLAIYYNKPNALKGNYPDVEIDCPKIKFSAGHLPQPVNTIVELTGDGLKFIWKNQGFSWPENQDRVMLLVYAPATKEKRFKHTGAMRQDGQDTLQITPSMRNTPLELYISFVSDDRKRAANSLYLGAFRENEFIRYQAQL